MTHFQVEITPYGACLKNNFLRHRAGENSFERESLCFCLVIRGADSNRPNDQTKGDLVENVRKVIDNVEGVCTCGRAASGQVAEEVADRIDRLADCDDPAHCVES